MYSLSDRDSSPSPEFTNEELSAYHSVENLIRQDEHWDNLISTPCTIILPTPTEEPGECPTQNTSNTSLNESEVFSKLDCFEISESSFLDSDADPEYVPLVENHRQISLLHDEAACCSKSLTTKRKRYPEKWKKNIRKTKCQVGEEFINNFNLTRKKREIKASCGESCPYSCNVLFNLSERQDIFDQFWKLNSKSKGEFFGKMVFRLPTERKRTSNTNSRRKHTYNYHFLKIGKLIRVCQIFFTNTLDINKTRIHYYFDNLIDNNTSTTKSPAKGRHAKNQLPKNKLDDVADHINGFATVDSHYCRSSSNKKYLESHLSLKKMYELYCNDFDDPVKFWAYKNIFETRFNLAFFVPKKDLCNRCEEHKTKQKNEITITPDEEKQFMDHVQNKILAKAEKDMDKANSDANTRVLVVDLQNVFSLPKANVNCFYYKRKLLCFNLTGYCLDNKTTYCAIWNETTQGRGANELANALLRILNAVKLNFPATQKIIIWTDSCIPQNRNSMVSLCIIKFLKDNPSIQSVEQKYSEPGHSLLQEVDAVHSTLERYLKNMEIYSPIGLIRLIINAKFPKVILKVLQLKPTDFWNYSKAVQQFNFSNVPYTKTRHLRYEARNPMFISYKRSFAEDFATESIMKPKSSRRTRNHSMEEDSNELHIQIVPYTRDNYRLAEEKRKDLKSMLKFMPKEDQHFYINILQTEKDKV